LPDKTENGLLAQLQEMSASNAVVSATGPTNVALVETEIAGVREIHTEGEAAADQEAVAADLRPAITKEEAAVIPETMADQKSSRKDAASFARRRDTSNVIALSSTAGVAIGSKEAEEETEEATGISDGDAIQEVVLLAEETTIGTQDGNRHHAPPHVASVSTQDQGLPLRVGTPPATWTGTGAQATNELLSEMASPSPTIF
jgi:hypothetical protein